MRPLTAKAKRRRQRSVALAASLALATIASGEDCPPLLDGWVPTPGCQQYYLCEGGKKSGPNYDCREGFLFDVSSTNCQQAAGVTCEVVGGGGDSSVEEPAAAGSASNETTVQMSEQAQTPPGDESCNGVPVVYFVDIPNQTCYNNCQKDKPEWVIEIFPTREQCCEKNFQWMPVEDCAGKEFVDDNGPKMWTLAPVIEESTAAPVSMLSSAAPVSMPSSLEPQEPIISPTLPPVEMSPDDPKFLFMCGVDWGDASARCYKRCPNGEDDECKSVHDSAVISANDNSSSNALSISQAQVAKVVLLKQPAPMESLKTHRHQQNRRYQHLAPHEGVESQLLLSLPDTQRSPILHINQQLELQKKRPLQTLPIIPSRK